MRFANKGRLIPGADADIVVFDPEVIYDNAAYVDVGEPDVPPEGIDWVIVSGKVAVKGKDVLEENGGKALRLARVCAECAYNCEKE